MQNKSLFQKTENKRRKEKIIIKSQICKVPFVDHSSYREVTSSWPFNFFLFCRHLVVHQENVCHWPIEEVSFLIWFWITVFLLNIVLREKLTVVYMVFQTWWINLMQLTTVNHSSCNVREKKKLPKLKQDVLFSVVKARSQLNFPS